jgi:DNA-binding XRE family transcriptional regulator
MRTSQAFASCETTAGVVRGAISAMIDNPKIVAKRLKHLREALGFESQVAFAKELGIGRNTYNPFERGTRELTFETACLIRQKFRIPIDWLFWGDDDELPYHVKVKLEARRQAA